MYSEILRGGANCSIQCDDMINVCATVNSPWVAATFLPILRLLRSVGITWMSPALVDFHLQFRTIGKKKSIPYHFLPNLK